MADVPGTDDDLTHCTREENVSSVREVDTRRTNLAGRILRILHPMHESTKRNSEVRAIFVGCVIRLQLRQNTGLNQTIKSGVLPL